MRLGQTTKCKSCQKAMIFRATGQKRHKNCALLHKREAVRTYRNSNPEITSVRSHFYFIFGTKNSNKNYKGMPFFDGWNPRKGGSHRAGGDWIIKNLGKRPAGCSLNVIDHAVGFVPGNLEWTGSREQNRNQLVKIIAQLRHRVRMLEAKFKC
jgi:hypothetical protein